MHSRLPRLEEVVETRGRATIFRNKNDKSNNILPGVAMGTKASLCSFLIVENPRITLCCEITRKLSKAENVNNK